MDKTPVYKYPGDYAMEHGELDLYRESGRANAACKEAIEKAVNGHYGNNRLDTKAAVREVVKQFGYDRTLYVLAVTVRHKDWDGRISRRNKDWARTVPVYANLDERGHDSNVYFVVDKCHPGLTDLFITAARHEHLLSLPLKAADIKAEATDILCQFQDAREPDGPGGTHFMAQVSPDFLARAKKKDMDRLTAILPFPSLTLSTVEGRRGVFALISRDEDRFRKLQLRRPSVREKLKQPALETAGPPARDGRAKAPER